jgi:hypothetical protein
MFIEILIGVSASLIALLVGWILRGFYNKGIRPLADRALYRGAAVEDNWETQLDFPDNTFNKLQIKLSRYGYNITGKVRCVEGYSSGEEFAFDGEFIPPLLTATYRALSPQNTERGAVALLLGNNGNILRGQIVYSDDEDNVILAAECILKRSASKFKW